MDGIGLLPLDVFYIYFKVAWWYNRYYSVVPGTAVLVV